MSGFLAVVDFLALDFLRHRGKRPCRALLGVQFFAGFLAELGAGDKSCHSSSSFRCIFIKIILSKNIKSNTNSFFNCKDLSQKTHSSAEHRPYAATKYKAQQQNWRQYKKNYYHYNEYQAPMPFPFPTVAIIVAAVIIIIAAFLCLCSIMNCATAAWACCGSRSWIFSHRRMTFFAFHLFIPYTSAWHISENSFIFCAVIGNDNFCVRRVLFP